MVEKPMLVKAHNVLKLGQMMEVSLLGESRAFVSRLEDIKDKTLVLDIPVDDNHKPLVLKAGTTIVCKAFDGRCFYKFKAVYREADTTKLSVWYLDMPVRVEKIQYRRFVRVKTDQTVVVRPVREDGSIEPMTLTSTVDMSGSGVCFMLDRPLPIKSKVTVELDNIPDIGLVQIMSQVVRCAEVEEKGKKRYQVAVEYVALDRKIQDKLVKLIFCLQRDGLAKGIDDL